MTIPSAWPESSFALPGGILSGDDPSSYRCCRSAVIRPLSGHEESWLASNRQLPNAMIVSRLLNSCVLQIDDEPAPKNIAQRMLVGDRDYLLLQLRRLTLGDRLSAVIHCPACGSKMDTDVDAASVPIEPRPQAELCHSVDVGDRIVSFRLPAGFDQEAVVGMDPDAAVAELFRRSILDDGGSPLTPAEQSVVIAAMEKVAPDVFVELQLTCPECAHEFVMPFDIASFFFDEMRIAGGQLFREVHTLAFYYHWTEAEILGLARERRRLYLSLLSDTLRGD
jgi:hypothetical protein